MCGRVTLVTPVEALAEAFEIDPGEPLPPLSPRYNIAPTMDLPIVRAKRADARRMIVLARWGLVPHWATDPSVGNRMINARAESVFAKPAYREAIRERRCLVPVDGFYEWRTIPGREKREPWYIRMRDGAPFALAGIWERWRPPGSPRETVPLETTTILTTDANDLVRPLHDRMPVIVAPEDYARWLDRTLEDPAALEPLFRPFPAERMVAHPVGLRVNRPEYDDPTLIEPVEPIPEDPEPPPAQKPKQGELPF